MRFNENNLVLSGIPHLDVRDYFPVGHRNIIKLPAKPHSRIPSAWKREIGFLRMDSAYYQYGFQQRSGCWDKIWWLPPIGKYSRSSLSTERIGAQARRARHKDVHGNPNAQGCAGAVQHRTC